MSQIEKQKSLMSSENFISLFKILMKFNVIISAPELDSILPLQYLLRWEQNKSFSGITLCLLGKLY